MYRLAARCLAGDAAYKHVCVNASVCEREKLIADAHSFFGGGHSQLIDLGVITFGMTGSGI